MWILAVFLWILKVSHVCFGQEEYKEYYEAGDDMGSEAPGEASGERLSLETARSVDELLELWYPEFSLLRHCQRKNVQLAGSYSSTPPPSSSSAAPLVHRPEEDGEDLWGRPREAALYKDDGTFEVILEEIQKTLCQPREVCVEVSKEYPESTSQFYLPRCVALHRCGGCCNNEAWYCTNTSHTLVNKTLVELSPPRMDRTVVMVTFVNHTACECLHKRPLHTIIRRAANEHLCPRPQIPCSPGLVWDAVHCLCVPTDTTHYSERESEALDSGLLALCGSNRALDQSSCECVCRNGLTEASCDPGWRLDHHTCECQCEVQGEGRWCPAGQRWDVELCGCVCEAECPGSQPLNPDTCQCQCRESPQSCLRQGKRFNRATCSCYRLPCRHFRKCQNGFHFSHQVCTCIPNHLRPEWK